MEPKRYCVEIDTIHTKFSALICRFVRAM